MIIDHCYRKYPVNLGVDLAQNSQIAATSDFYYTGISNTVTSIMNSFVNVNDNTLCNLIIL